MYIPYPLPRSNLVEEDSEISAKNQPESQLPKRKKQKAMPFSQLLTNEALLKSLRDTEEATKKKANEIKCKKKTTAQKQLEQETKKAQREEAKKKS
ncbi:10191_t:CDS:2 [Dentiscutata heterogama]|uniref:10191_t:CDS:1 n=1 Tax=Dentiscutata heterogama TaxID=1316150 RepID=A0ACA9N6S6_9GLOM|nr:10191_t:CDS:2 [Dentiscutata heterogama]